MGRGVEGTVHADPYTGGTPRFPAMGPALHLYQPIWSSGGWYGSIEQLRRHNMKRCGHFSADSSGLGCDARPSLLRCTRLLTALHAFRMQVRQFLIADMPAQNRQNSIILYIVHVLIHCKRMQRLPIVIKHIPIFDTNYSYHLALCKTSQVLLRPIIVGKHH